MRLAQASVLSTLFLAASVAVILMLQGLVPWHIEGSPEFSPTLTAKELVQQENPLEKAALLDKSVQAVAYKTILPNLWIGFDGSKGSEIIAVQNQAYVSSGSDGFVYPLKIAVADIRGSSWLTLEQTLKEVGKFALRVQFSAAANIPFSAAVSIIVPAPGRESDSIELGEVPVTKSQITHTIEKQVDLTKYPELEKNEWLRVAVFLPPVTGFEITIAQFKLQIAKID